MFLQACQIAIHRVFDICQRLIIGSALGDAAGQGGNLGNKNAVFVLFNDDTVFHSTIVTPFGRDWLPQPLAIFDRRGLHPPYRGRGGIGVGKFIKVI